MKQEKKGKSAYEPTGSSGWSLWRFLYPGCDAGPSQGYVTGTIYTTGRRRTVRVKCLALKHNTMFLPGSNPYRANPEATAPASLREKFFFKKKLTTISKLFFGRLTQITQKLSMTCAKKLDTPALVAVFSLKRRQPFRINIFLIFFYFYYCNITIIIIIIIIHEQLFLCTTK